jgi:hypothetical protein
MRYQPRIPFTRIEVDKTKSGLEARGVLGMHDVDNQIQVVGD